MLTLSRDDAPLALDLFHPSPPRCTTPILSLTQPLPRDDLNRPQFNLLSVTHFFPQDSTSNVSPVRTTKQTEQNSAHLLRSASCRCYQSSNASNLLSYAICRYCFRYDNRSSILLSRELIYRALFSVAVAKRRHLVIPSL